MRQGVPQRLRRAQRSSGAAALVDAPRAAAARCPAARPRSSPCPCELERELPPFTRSRALSSARPRARGPARPPPRQGPRARSGRSRSPVADQRCQPDPAGRPPPQDALGDGHRRRSSADAVWKLSCPYNTGTARAPARLTTQRQGRSTASLVPGREAHGGHQHRDARQLHLGLQPAAPPAPPADAPSASSARVEGPRRPTTAGRARAAGRREPQLGRPPVGAGLAWCRASASGSRSTLQRQPLSAPAMRACSADAARRSTSRMRCPAPARLEGIDRVGRDAAGVDQAGPASRASASPQRPLRQPAAAPTKSCANSRPIAAPACATSWGRPASRSRPPAGGLAGRRGPRGMPPAGGAAESTRSTGAAGLHDRLVQLLDEQRHAVGALGDLLREAGGQRPPGRRPARPAPRPLAGRAGKVAPPSRAPARPRAG